MMRTIQRMMWPLAALFALCLAIGALLAWMVVTNETGDDYLLFEVIEGVERSRLDWTLVVFGAIGLAIGIFVPSAFAIVLVMLTQKKH